MQKMIRQTIFRSTLPLITQVRVTLAHDETTDTGLQVGDDGGQFVFTQLLKLTEDTGLEEDLGVTNTVAVTEVQSGEDLLRGDLAVNEARWDGIRSEDGITGEQQLIKIDYILYNMHEHYTTE